MYNVKLQRYYALEKELIQVRSKHEDLESEEEDSILDAMEEIWYELSEKEQNKLNKNPFVLDTRGWMNKSCEYEGLNTYRFKSYRELDKICMKCVHCGNVQKRMMFCECDLTETDLVWNLDIIKGTITCKRCGEVAVQNKDFSELEKKTCEIEEESPKIVFGETAEQNMDNEKWWDVFSDTMLVGWLVQYPPTEKYKQTLVMFVYNVKDFAQKWGLLNPEGGSIIQTDTIEKAKGMLKKIIQQDKHR